MTWAEAFYRSVIVVCAFAFLAHLVDKIAGYYRAQLITYTRKKVGGMELETGTGELSDDLRKSIEIERDAADRDVASTSGRRGRIL